jgi:tRNA G18 (ribose-2'-O)-methylase SpoU
VRRDRDGAAARVNVGAIFRSAAALGMGAVILSPRCADPLYRRSVKVSMGAVFAVGDGFDGTFT